MEESRKNEKRGELCKKSRTSCLFPEIGWMGYAKIPWGNTKIMDGMVCDKFGTISKERGGGERIEGVSYKVFVVRTALFRYQSLRNDSQVPDMPDTLLYISTPYMQISLRVRWWEKGASYACNHRSILGRAPTKPSLTA